MPLTWYPYFQPFSSAKLLVKLKKKNCPQISGENGPVVKKISWGKIWRKLIKIGSLPNTIWRVDSGWVKDLNVKGKIAKLMETHVGEYLCDFSSERAS